MGLGGIIGAAIAKPPDYEKIKNNYKLLRKSYNNLKIFYNKWKNVIRAIQRRVETLRKNKIKIDETMPRVTQGVLRTAIKCYISGLLVPACIMATRATEIHMRFVRKKLEKCTNDVDFNNLITWAKDQEFISGLENEAVNYLRKARNWMVHQPTRGIKEIDALHALHSALKIISKVSIEKR